MQLSSTDIYSIIKQPYLVDRSASWANTPLVEARQHADQLLVGLASQIQNDQSSFRTSKRLDDLLGNNLSVHPKGYPSDAILQTNLDPISHLKSVRLCKLHVLTEANKRSSYAANFMVFFTSLCVARSSSVAVLRQIPLEK